MECPLRNGYRKERSHHFVDGVEGQVGVGVGVRVRVGVRVGVGVPSKCVGDWRLGMGWLSVNVMYTTRAQSLPLMRLAPQ